MEQAADRVAVPRGKLEKVRVLLEGDLFSNEGHDLKEIEGGGIEPQASAVQKHASLHLPNNSRQPPRLLAHLVAHRHARQRSRDGGEVHHRLLQLPEWRLRTDYTLSQLQTQVLHLQGCDGL